MNNPLADIHRERLDTAVAFFGRSVPGVVMDVSKIEDRPAPAW